MTLGAANDRRAGSGPAWNEREGNSAVSPLREMHQSSSGRGTPAGGSIRANDSALGSCCSSRHNDDRICIYNGTTASPRCVDDYGCAGIEAKGADRKEWGEVKRSAYAALGGLIRRGFVGRNQSAG